MNKHISAVAALHVGYGIFRILIVFLIFFLFNAIGRIADEPHAAYILVNFSTIIGLFMLVITIPGIIGGIALFCNKYWARILLLIVSALNLLCIPFGTALGAYSIWVLVQEETQKILKAKK